VDDAAETGRQVGRVGHVSLATISQDNQNETSPVAFCRSSKMECAHASPQLCRPRSQILLDGMTPMEFILRFTYAKSSCESLFFP